MHARDWTVNTCKSLNLWYTSNTSGICLEDQAVMDEQFTAFSPNKQNTSNKKMRAFLYVGVFILIIAGAIFLGNQLLSSSNEPEVTPTPTMEATPTEEPTPTEEASKSAEKETTPTPTAKAKTTPAVSPTTGTATTPVAGSLTIKVLNGSGEKGVAGTVATLLKDNGYTVSSTGNADNFDYADTVIQIKKSKQAGLAKLKSALSADYTVSASTVTLAETEDVDAIVIVGTN